ncbi:unnamed protein product [Cuscuta europaea]|uniref:Uncharacterized protein n=1 Tax=Cuscuta europaea TaxID=41803 RepID=A0A9P1E360_CUSEU|nr:unnamed protein product [Cuscuta europaea]
MSIKSTSPSPKRKPILAFKKKLPCVSKHPAAQAKPNSHQKGPSPTQPSCLRPRVSPRKLQRRTSIFRISKFEFGQTSDRLSKPVPPCPSPPPGSATLGSPVSQNNQKHKPEQ